MANELARIVSYGDLHLSSKNYGAHIDYPKDSLNSLRIVRDIVRDVNATHCIGLGDLSYGRFNNLEYREAVEKLFGEISEVCDHYELKGNHDTAGYGMTEFEYYERKGCIKKAENISIGNVNITMVDYNKYNEIIPNIKMGDYINFIFMHDYFKCKDTRMPDYGSSVNLDDFEKWFGADYIVGGHIHNSHVFEGLMVKTENNQNIGHRVMVDYLGSLSRPSYREGNTDDNGHVLVITVYDDNTIKYDRMDIKLPDINDTFNIADKLKKKEIEDSKHHVDLSDVAHRLDGHERNIGNPEDIIMGMNNIPDKYKEKAVDLLKMCLG